MTVRLAHFTDVHFTTEPREVRWRDFLSRRPPFFSKRALGWGTLKFRGRCEHFSSAETIVAALLRDLESIEFDAAVFTGDYTGMSYPHEFERARRAFAPLFASDVDVTSIPGNHDVYVPSVVEYSLYEKWFGEWTKTDLASSDFPEPFQKSYPYPLVRLLDPDVALILLRDVCPRHVDSSGELPENQIRALDWLLGSDVLGGRTAIVALHYGLARSDGSPDTKFHGLAQAPAVLSLCRSHGVALVIHGHLHDRFVHPAGTVGASAIANPGSLTHTKYAQSYHVYEISAGEVSLEARRYNRDSGEFECWADAPTAGTIWSRETATG